MKKLRLYPRLTNGSQFGMDEDTIRSVFGIVNMSPYLEIEGIHYFSGTQKRHLRQFRQELEIAGQASSENERRVESTGHASGIRSGYRGAVFPGKKNHRHIRMKD